MRCAMTFALADCAVSRAQIRFRLMQRGFERPMIQREQHLFRLNIVALVEVDLRQLAGHLRSDGDGRERLGRADDVRVERHDFLDHSIDGDGHRGLRRTRFWTLRVACRHAGSTTLIPSKRPINRRWVAGIGESYILASTGACLNSLNSADTIV